MEKGERRFRFGRGFVFCLAITLLLAGMSGAVDGAEKYPNRPINLIVPYAAGGPRIWAVKSWPIGWLNSWANPWSASTNPGRRVPGAAIVAKAKPDGYTVLVGVPPRSYCRPS